MWLDGGGGVSYTHCQVHHNGVVEGWCTLLLLKTMEEMRGKQLAWESTGASTPKAARFPASIPWKAQDPTYTKHLL